MPSLSGEFQHEFVDMVRLLVEEVAAADLKAPQRETLAHHLCKAFLDQWAGCNLYIPYGHTIGPAADIASCKARRDAMIRAECDGTALSVYRLARRYGVSETSIWRAVKGSLTGVSRADCADQSG